MKKVTVLADANSPAEAMAGLRALAVLHLRLDQPPNRPELEHLHANEKRIAEAQSITDTQEVDASISPSSDSGEHIARRLLDLQQRSDQLHGKLAELREQHDQLSLLGITDPDRIDDLNHAGIRTHLRRVPLEEWTRLSQPPVVHVLARNQDYVWIAEFSDRLGSNLPGILVVLPSCSRTELETEIKQLEDEATNVHAEIRQLSQSRRQLADARHECRDALALTNADRAMTTHHPVIAISGYCPERRLDALRTAARENGWALRVTEPDEEEAVPTLLRHNRLSRLFQPVMDALGLLPGYREFHTHVLFLFFFTLFFAMIIGDAGYGLLMLAVTSVIAKRCPGVPRNTLALSALLGSATLVWGALTGAWFGVEQLRHTAPLSWVVVPGLDTWTKASQSNVIRFCLGIGAVHLIVARLWAAARKRGGERLAEIGWICVVAGTCLAAFKLLLNEGQWAAPAVCLALGVILLIVFGEQQRDQPFAMGVVWGVIKLPINLLSFVSSFSDAVSYIRLFAVGLATLEMASAFNHLAAGIGWNSITSAIGAAVVIVLGHTVNLLLAAMGVLVHGIRLNLLEFSRHLGMAWTGVPYEPFRPLDKEP